MLKVLLVDDEPFILEGLQTIVNWKDYGMEIAGQAGNGIDALNYLSQNQVDILMTDITMPMMNGIELIENVKKVKPDTRFIVFSGYNDFEYVREGIKLGIENYLLKPLNVQELVATLKNTVTKIQKSALTEAYIKRDREILRDNILYRWSTNSIDPGELSERADILGINLGYSYYIVSTIKVLPDSSEGIEPVTALYHQAIYEAFLLCSRIVSYYSVNGICFCDLDGDIVIIYGTDTEAKSECGINTLLDNLCTQLEAKTRLSFITTCGSMQPGCLNIYLSYECAKKLQEYSLVCNDRIIDYDRLLAAPPCTSTDVAIGYNTLSILLATGKRNEASSFIDGIFKALNDAGNIAPDVVINYSMKIISHLNETVNEFAGGNETPGWNYRALISGLSVPRTSARLKEYLENAVLKAIDLVSAGHSRMSPFIRQVLNYINSNYQEDIGLKGLAQLYKINPVYFGQLFQKETGELFTDYVNKMKMKKARELLLSTNMKVVEISQKLGCSNSNYFCTQFKKYTGLSPSEVRELQNVKTMDT